MFRFSDIPLRRLLRRATLGALLIGVAALLAWLLLPWPLVYRWRNPEMTSFMQFRERQAEAEGREWDPSRSWVSLNDIAPVVVRAVVEAEDGRFREHQGLDWVALGEELRYQGDGAFSWLDPRDLRALVDGLAYGWTHRDELRGRSTITQQLAKNLYFTPDRTLGRKIAELAVARRLELLLGKDRILELYLNTVELGPGLFGVDAAAREYFGIPAARLGTWEAATLAATLPHPLTSNPHTRPGRMAWRRDLILQRLRGPEQGNRSPIPTAPPPPDAPTGPDLPAEPDTLRLPPPDTVGSSMPDSPRQSLPDTGRSPDTLRPRPPDTLQSVAPAQDVKSR